MARNEVTVVFSGKSGAGKSTLTTNILKIESLNAEVDTPNAGLSAKPVTDACRAYNIERNGVTLRVVDTIGLISDSNMRKQLKNIIEYTNREIGLLVYCLPVGPESKFVNGNPAIMKAIQNAFGKEVWKHCLLVFTFSDLVWNKMTKKAKNDVDSAVVSYQQHLRQYAALFEEQLKTLGVNDVEVHTIFDNPIREVDHPTIVAVPAGEERDDEVLPGIPVDEDGKWMGIVLREMILSCRGERRDWFRRFTDGWSWEKTAMVVGVVLLFAMAF